MLQSDKFFRVRRKQKEAEVGISCFLSKENTLTTKKKKENKVLTKIKKERKDNLDQEKKSNQDLDQEKKQVLRSYFFSFKNSHL